MTQEWVMLRSADGLVKMIYGPFMGRSIKLPMITRRGFLEREYVYEGEEHVNGVKVTVYQEDYKP